MSKLKLSHLIVRKDHSLCTNCFKIEPVHCGDGTALDTMIMGYEFLALRHQNCVPLKAGEKRRL
jgi:hypothetical protein